MQARDTLLLLLPAFLLPLLLDAAAARLAGGRRYRFNDALANVNLALLSTFTGLIVASLTLAVYHYAHTTYAVTRLSIASPLAWLAAFLLYDFLYYWNHRLHHELAFLWGSHSVHHSGEDMNFGLAIRQSMFGQLTSWPLYVPMALLGIPLELFLAMNGLQLVYQYLIHNTFCPRLGVVEKWLQTPALHRVHHARNTLYLDKNYGNILTIWDRMFSSYQPELTDTPPVYGLRESIASFSPLALNFQYYRALFRKILLARSWRDKAKCIFMKPAWIPPAHRPDPAPLHSVADVPSARFRKFDPRIALSRQIAGVCRAVSALAFFVLLMWHLDQLSPPLTALLFVLLLTQCHTCGVAFGSGRLSWAAELLQLAMALGASGVAAFAPGDLPVEWLAANMALIAGSSLLMARQILSDPGPSGEVR